jgi:hypothetical protein
MTHAEMGPTAVWLMLLLGAYHGINPGMGWLFAVEFLPNQHEPSHVQIAEQRTDRRPLLSTSTFVPIARTPTFVPTLVGFLDRCFQPHLDQMQHRSVNDSFNIRLSRATIVFESCQTVSRPVSSLIARKMASHRLH